MKLVNTPELRAHRRRITQAERLYVTFFQVQKGMARIQDGKLCLVDVAFLSPPLSSRYKAKKRLRQIRKTHPTAKIVSHTAAFDEEELDVRKEFKRSIK
ncbi:hypothetical protein [Herbaspirillum rubrisubalbicans]|uniref:Uncharacterized protein n=1 Tax=Herbaspirillum rubrisubalbicans TaxID=80842 RepID=A0AAD0XFZ5_9BURK|nr:hypothetical protein [Herbaspirillum rubrisubalbicans]AYR23000.1 hypothetical protein RC54_03825 [Herbaspirillum rubrisubalbicans]